MTEDELKEIHGILMMRRTVDENGCWLYHGTKKNKHRVMYWKEMHWAVHRLSWLVYKGEDPGKLFVCHKCDVPECFNPDHLFLGTPQDNMDDMRRKGRGRWPGRTTGIALLTRQQQQEIYDKYMNAIGKSVTYSKLAEEYGVSIGTIYRVIKESVG